MNTRWLTALALVAAFVGALVWIASAGREKERASVAASSPSANARVERDVSPADAHILETALAPPLETKPQADGVVSIPLAPSSASSTRSAARSAYDLELDAARWVEGRVVFPPGTPDDERAFVVAKGKGFEHGPPHRAAVAVDGAFRVAFAAGTAAGRLELEAHYLRLERPERVTLAEDHPQVVLRPVLGGVVRGRLVPPEPGAELARELAGTKLTLELKESAGAEVDPGARFHACDVGADLAFEIGGLAAGDYRLEFAAPAFLPVSIDGVAVELGRVRTLDVPLARGVTLAGRVLDGAGRPVAEAYVLASCRAEGEAYGPTDGSALSDVNGAFVLRGLEPGWIQLSARPRGFKPATVEVDGLVDGESRAGIEIVLERGLSIAGRVLWPDGTGAAGALVRATREDGDAGRLFGSRWKTDGDGRFEIDGLDEGTFRIEASADLGAASQSASQPDGQTTLRATAQGVAAGSDDVELALNSGALVRGRVIDDLGAPVRAFTIHATRAGASVFPAREAVTADFEDPAGNFELAGLQPGAWELDARSPEGPASSPQLVEVPGSVDLLELVVRAGGSLAGEAHDADGSPLAGREIEVSSLAANQRATLTLVTDGAGRFFAENVPPGGCKVRVLARETDVKALLAPDQDSGPLERSVFVEIVPRETTHVTLTLPAVEPVRLSGRVLAGDQPVARASLTFHDRGENGALTGCVSDEEGRYSIVLGRPGDYFVGLSAQGGFVLTDRVEIPARESFELDFAFAVGRISGRVQSLAREPLAGIDVEALGDQRETPLKSSGAVTDEAGRYSLLVPAGTYLVRAGGTNSMRAAERVWFGESRVEGVVVERDARIEDVDLVLEPGGAVEGGVRWEDGTSAERVFVGVFDASGMQIAGNASGAGGRFRIEGIRPGTVLLEALDQKPLAVARAEVHVSAGQTSEVELVLARATFLVVRTLDGALNDVAAEVEIEDARARVCRRLAGSVGNETLGPFEAGRTTVRARHGGREVEQVVELRGEAVREIELIFR